MRFTFTRLKKNPDLTRDLESYPLLEQISSDDHQKILIKTAPNPTCNPLLQHINRAKDIWNKLPDSWIIKAGALLLSIIFAPIGLVLGLTLALVFLALTCTALVLLTAFALIATPIKWIIACFSEKKIEILNYLDHINSERKTNETSEITPLLFKDNKTYQSPYFLNFIQKKTEEKATEINSPYQKMSL